MWDNHCHLADFNSDELPSILQSATVKGVQKFITSASSFDNFAENIAIAATFDNVFVTLGLHPLFLPDASLSSIDKEFKNILTTELQKNPKKLVALGEIGLDFGAKLADFEKNKQVDFFVYQLQVAQNAQLPVVLHIQKAHKKAIEVLQKSEFKQKGLIHAFNSGVNEANFYCKNGFKLGIGTGVLNPKSTKLLAKISRLNLKDMVLETDSPFMSPFFDKANNPGNLVFLAQKLADIFSTTKDEVIKITSANSQALWFK